MKSFNTYLSSRPLQSLIHEIATMMVEQELNPQEWLINWAGDVDQNLQDALIQDQIEGMRRFHELAPQMAQMASQPQMPTSPGFGQTMGNMANTAGSALGTMGKQFMNYFTGPQARFSAAVKAIDGLSQTISKDPQMSQMRTADGKELLTKWLFGIKNTLMQSQTAIPAQTTQNASTGWKQPHTPMTQANFQQPTGATPPSLPGTQQMPGAPPVH